ncbi:MAG: type IV pili methyl-accepting chemotaxis transducer N-terminal domain-containing protein [Aquabacterium sp.]|uniref:type IV pili methyl-accepting chemotaxis transducer N-terminal domain-containing protein n=1 Tax=Aquabacterium sp. TaxID=1872578 RepID=UPI001DF6CB41|nr:type IV pili methyl-accepting chemotaxis transducer N-terminal domain-containing protein [Aquabacterium sp.]MBT9608495.1 type IV pili methyl-accepting chemotaxis transducer N-terminal domain-containing protein [Aquabacterium sp.]
MALTPAGTAPAQPRQDATPWSRTYRLTLARKLAAVGCVFLAVALATVGLSMWVTWQLEGGAAAINEAGRMRMRAYQLALQVREQPVLAGGVTGPLQARLTELDDSLALLTSGDPQRPLSVPGSAPVQARLQAVQQGWQVLRAEVQAHPGAPVRLSIEPFVQQVDQLVSEIEQRLEARTVALHTFQMVMMVLAVLSALAILYASHVMVLDPVARLRNALRRVEEGDFQARVRPGADDELGELAEGFNRMTERLQAQYGDLEAKVREKTLGLEHEQARLRALYEVSTFVASADNLSELGQGFARQMRSIARADAVAVRWSDEANDRYMLLASDSLPHILAREEQCVLTGDCFCGDRLRDGVPARMRVIPIAQASPAAGEGAPPHLHPDLHPQRQLQRRCEVEGYTTLVTLPLLLQQRLLGEVELFYRGDITFSDGERNLFEALASHLAGAMESLRMAALARQSAVASERKLLAQELHDSIAQSLAFLKIQMGLLRSAQAQGDQAGVQAAMAELDTGVRESYNDVRELLLHFRVRTESGRLDLALRETLSKFELQSGLSGHLSCKDDGVPMPADVQIQVLHIVQEALSNVRKHARARQVWVDVQAHPAWVIRVRDDGQGFAPEAGPADATHVGLSIMRERAERIGATVAVNSGPQGTEVCLSLPANPPTHNPPTHSAPTHSASDTD